MFTLVNLIDVQSLVIKKFYEMKEKSINEIESKIRAESNEVERQILLTQLAAVRAEKLDLHSGSPIRPRLFGLF